MTASCTGSHISGYATPQDGWTVELISAGPVRLEVELHREHHETHLIATCEDGVPVAETRTSDGEHDDDHHDDGHD